LSFPRLFPLTSVLPFGRNGGTYGAFQSKDPILAIEKSGDADRSGANEHGITVHHPTS
jgi:hypothetical protein